MKSHIDFSLKGRDLWKPYFLFWVIFLILYVPILILGNLSSFQRVHPRLYLLILAVDLLAIFLVLSIYTIIFNRILLPKVAVAGDAFSFAGSIGRYLRLFMSGMVLSAITLSVYFPWFLRRITAYVYSQQSFRGATPEFFGRAGKLFKYLVLSVWVPIVIVIVLVGLAIGLGQSTASTPAVLISLMTFLATFVILIPFVYFLYKWYVSVRWNDVTITWDTHAWASCGMLLCQMLLVVITLSIYWPTAFLRLYRYFIGKWLLGATFYEAAGSR